jgi:hypothetical protein
MINIIKLGGDVWRCNRVWHKNSAGSSMDHPVVVQQKNNPLSA